MSRNFKDWINAYLEYTAFSEAPDQFHRWTAVATIAGALRRRVWVDMGYFKWYPNFFLIFVAPPGIVSKSTTADIGMALLRRVPGIKFGPSSASWQSLIPALIDSKEEIELPNATYLPMCSLTFVASELGTFLRPGDNDIINLLTDLWDGKDDPFRKLTKKDGEEVVENPWVQLVGCTTPAWIAENFSTYFIGGGFASRTLFVYEDHKRQLVAYPTQAFSLRQPELGARLTEDLESIARLVGEYRLTAGAIRWGTEWYASHYASDNPLRVDERFGGYIGRKQTHVHKVAMVLAAARRDELIITEEDLREAAESVTALEPNMMMVFGHMNREKITDQQAMLLQVIHEHKKISKGDLYRIFLTKMGYETFEKCLDALFGAKVVELVQEGTTVYIKFAAEDLVRKLTSD